MIRVRNITNAFVKIEHGDRVFLADPWVSDGIFDGGWSPYPPIHNPGEALRVCDYLYISHIHEDHFDLEAIARLPRTCTVLIPDIYPNHLIQQRAIKLGFRSIMMLKPLEPAQLAPDLTVVVIPPLNAFGQEEEYYKKSLESVAVDSGILINWAGTKIILLNDDTPYDLSPLHAYLNHFAGCDLLALNYNGGADDYPICYRNLSEEEKVALCELRDRKKLEANLRLISVLQPKAVMAYSSEFSARGPQAKAFAKLRAGLYNDKTLMAQHLAQITGIKAFALFEEDILEIDTQSSKKVAGQGIYPSVENRAEQLYSGMPNYIDRFPRVEDLSALRRDAKLAADHMFSYMNKYDWSSEWILEVQLKEDVSRLCVDLRNGEVSNRYAPRDRKVLRCFTDTRYFSALMRRLTHWNNAMISYNLEWERFPNEYDPILYKALNFFHI